MRSEALWPKLIMVFAITVVLYLFGFYGLEYRRRVHGPWEVKFAVEQGTPSLVVGQAYLGITNVSLRFPGGISTNTVAPQTIVFDSPGKTLPFGESPFADLTFLPGTITFKLCGHTVELIPRVLAVDGHEHPWVSDTSFIFPAQPEPAKK